MDKFHLLKSIYASYKANSKMSEKPSTQDEVKLTFVERHRRSRDVVLSSIMKHREYRILGKKGEGTFSEVLKCQHIKDGSNWACKKMKQHYDSIEQVNNLREIQAMKRLSPHPNILELQEVVFDKKSGVLVLVCELMEMNIYELIRGRRQYLAESKVKSYMYQLCKSLDHMHRNGIFHRDVKPENILIRDEVLKLADFGSCRSIYSKQPYTEYISTRWYRAPECLLTDGFYSYKMDIWSIGCVFFEILSLHPLFPGSNEVDQIAKIHDVLGTPDPNVLNKLKNKTRGINFNFPPKKGTGIEKMLQHCSSHCVDLIYQMCTYDPDERITAKQALKHPYFKELRDADKRAAAMSKVSSKETVDVNNNNKDGSDSKSTKIDNHDGSSRTVTSDVSAIVKPLHHNHHRDKRKKRHRHKISEAHGNPMLPKVPQNHTSSFHPTFTASFPKIGGTASTTVLPSITNTYKPKTKASQASKNVFGHYQLPSIDRRGAGY